jgi:protein Tex
VLFGESAALQPRALMSAAPSGMSTVPASTPRTVSALKSVSASAFTADGIREITECDVLAELEKPGHDPRPEFKVAKFNDGVNNVPAFGAFVDVGAHQDGLVHVSQLANKFVKDPKDLVKAGQIVKVKVVEADIQCKRIALTMRLDVAPISAEQRHSRGHDRRGDPTNRQPAQHRPA